jgi:hypothetical protein
MKTLLFILIAVISLPLQAQTTAADSVRQAQSYYRLGVQYKDGNGVTMDYAKAFDYFAKAANLGDAQSIYALGYLHYKGLGCTQDYTLAATLFAQGSSLGKDNSMYFYGLCWRNGYGVAKNEDSAKYWLNKAAANGYKQAVQELKMIAAENSNDSARILVQQINTASLPGKITLNQYTKIEQHLPTSDIIKGVYEGYLIGYDWSGQHVISSKKLRLGIAGSNKDELSGEWVEDNSDSVAIEATLTADSIVFKSTQYRRTDHYSPDRAILYEFKDARLNLVQKRDSVFLAGNIRMYSPERKEPSKFLFVALTRGLKGVITAIPETSYLKSYPNPFTSTLNVEFNLIQSANTEVQLLTPEGRILYRNPSGWLEPGRYQLPLHPGYLSAGTYLVKLIYSKHTTVIKVMKN